MSKANATAGGGWGCLSFTLACILLWLLFTVGCDEVGRLAKLAVRNAIERYEK